MKRWSGSWDQDWKGWRGDWDNGWGWKDDTKETPKWEQAKWEDKRIWEREDHRRPKRAQRGETDEENRPKKLKGNRVDFSRRWTDLDSDGNRPKIPRPPQQERKKEEPKRESGMFAFFRFFGGRT